MARRVICRVTPETTAATATATAVAESTAPAAAAPVERPLLPPLTGAVMCAWCHFERTGIRGLPAGVDSRTCERHVRALFEEIASRRGETLADVLERAERVAENAREKARVPA